MPFGCFAFFSQFFLLPHLVGDKQGIVVGEGVTVSASEGFAKKGGTKFFFANKAITDGEHNALGVKTCWEKNIVNPCYLSNKICYFLEAKEIFGSFAGEISDFFEGNTSESGDMLSGLAGVGWFAAFSSEGGGG